MCRLSKQEPRVLTYIEKHGAITSYDAFVDLGVTRLAAVIFNLKKKGYKIASKTIEVTNRWGETCHVSEYYIEKGENKND